MIGAVQQLRNHFRGASIKWVIESFKGFKSFKSAWFNRATGLVSCYTAKVVRKQFDTVAVVSGLAGSLPVTTYRARCARCLCPLLNRIQTTLSTPRRSNLLA